MEKADPCAQSGVILFGSCSLPQILGTNGLVVVVVVVVMLEACVSTSKIETHILPTSEHDSRIFNSIRDDRISRQCEVRVSTKKHETHI